MNNPTTTNLPAHRTEGGTPPKSVNRVSSRTEQSFRGRPQVRSGFFAAVLAFALAVTGAFGFATPAYQQLLSFGSPGTPEGPPTIAARGGNPEAEVIQGADRALYGTASYGGVFRFFISFDSGNPHVIEKGLLPANKTM